MTKIFLRTASNLRNFRFYIYMRYAKRWTRAGHKIPIPISSRQTRGKNFTGIYVFSIGIDTFPFSVYLSLFGFTYFVSSLPNTANTSRYLLSSVNPSINEKCVEKDSKIKFIAKSTNNYKYYSALIKRFHIYFSFSIRCIQEIRSI